jgi:hypothetical protein
MNSGAPDGFKKTHNFLAPTTEPLAASFPPLSRTRHSARPDSGTLAP